MERILTFAEFAKSFDQKGTELGNTQSDVDALTKSTDQFTADGGSSCPEEGGATSPSLVDGGGDKVITLAVQPDEEEVTDDNGEEGEGDDFIQNEDPETEIEDDQEDEPEEE